ncbi:MAG: phage tail tape measure protein, partial [bacterium]|nr:phage tail tape measure protein [bacterium]
MGVDVELAVGISAREAKAGAEEVNRALKKMAKNANGTQRQMKTLQTRMSSMAGAFRKISMISSTITFGFMAGAVKTFASFEAAVSDLSAITGATGKDLKFLSDAAREFGATTTLSATEAAEAFKLVASAKPELLENAEALKRVTAEAITLAEATGMQLPTAAATLGAALNQFSAGADQASRFINVLAAGAKYGASEVADTGQALKMAGVVAAQAGLDFEETNTAIQLLAKGALKGSQAGTGLRSVLLKLTTQANSEFNPAVVGMADALKNLRDAGLDATAMKKLFGEEAIVAAQLLMKEAHAYDELTEKLRGTNTAYEQQKVRVDNMVGDMKALWSAVQEVAIAFGSGLSQSLRGVIQDMTGGARGMTAFAEAAGKVVGKLLSMLQYLDEVAVVFGTLAAMHYLGPLLMTVGTGFTAIASGALTAKISTMGLSAALVAATAATKAQAAAIALLGGPGGAFILASIAGYKLISVISKIKEQAKESAEAIKDHAGAAKQISAEMHGLDILPEGEIQKKITNVKELLTNIQATRDAINKKLSGRSDMHKALFPQELKNSIAELRALIQPTQEAEAALKLLEDQLVKVQQQKLDTPGGISDELNKIDKKALDAGESLRGMIQEMDRSNRQTGMTEYQKVQDSIKDGGSEIGQLLGQVLPAHADLFAQALLRVAGTADTMANQVTSKFKGMASQMRQSIATMGMLQGQAREYSIMHGTEGMGMSDKEKTEAVGLVRKEEGARHIQSLIGPTQLLAQEQERLNLLVQQGSISQQQANDVYARKYQSTLQQVDASRQLSYSEQQGFAIQQQKLDLQRQEIETDFASKTISKADATRQLNGVTQENIALLQEQINKLTELGDHQGVLQLKQKMSQLKGEVANTTNSLGGMANSAGSMANGFSSSFKTL